MVVGGRAPPAPARSVSSSSSSAPRKEGRKEARRPAGRLGFGNLGERASERVPPAAVGALGETSAAAAAAASSFSNPGPSPGLGRSCCALVLALPAGRLESFPPRASLAAGRAGPLRGLGLGLGGCCARRSLACWLRLRLRLQHSSPPSHQHQPAPTAFEDAEPGTPPSRRWLQPELKPREPLPR